VLFLLVVLGRSGMVQENDKRVAEWARAQGVELIRVDRDPLLQRHDRPLWRIRVRTAAGETRDAIARAGWSIHEPVEVEWAKPGVSVFR
jgi:hypothetical protein